MPSRPDLGSGGETAEASERLELGASGVVAPGTPVAAEAVANGSGGPDGRHRRTRPCGSRTPVSPPASTSRRPLAAELRRRFLGRRPPGGPGIGAAATGRGVEPDVLPTAGGPARGPDEDVHAAGTRRPEHAQQIAGARVAEDDEALRPDGGTR